MNAVPGESTTYVSGVISRPCFYCLGDRPEQYGTLSDFVVLYIADRANSFEEARREFEAYKQEVGEEMRLNAIVKAATVQYYEPIR